MTDAGCFLPIESLRFKGWYHRTTASKATRRERRAPEAGRYASSATTVPR
jgi:hypothetical protein